MLYLYSLLLILIADVAFAQTLAWKRLLLPKADDRYNDIWFADPMIGWAVIPSDQNDPGIIYKTTDGGDTWTSQFESPRHLRSVCFFDSLIGFVGFIRSDTAS